MISIVLASWTRINIPHLVCLSYWTFLEDSISIDYSGLYENHSSLFADFNGSIRISTLCFPLCHQFVELVGLHD